ncbi:AzlC family ABC transporter permease [Pasteurellaceae bacterium LIM206]|nr:AzlC family ABC transporter permease [Pasteurellaceae bacterium LIM206]
MSDVISSPHSIRDAAKAALPYSAPMIAGFLFLGITYGIYMKALGFSVWYPLLMAALIYAGSVEFIVAAALVAPFAPAATLLVCLMVSGRQVFYGISMLEKYGARVGKKRWYLIASLVDEAFSLNYMARVPAHIDKGWYYLFVSLYLHIYWVLGAVVGNLFGNILPFDLKGVEFGMIALFIVIFAENWSKEKSHESSLLGLGIAFLCLITVGKDSFLIPTLLFIWAALTLRRPKLGTKLRRIEQQSASLSEGESQQ